MSKLPKKTFANSFRNRGLIFKMTPICFGRNKYEQFRKGVVRFLLDISEEHRFYKCIKT